MACFGSGTPISAIVGRGIFMLTGMRHAPGAVAAVVMATTPAVTAIGSVPFLGDRLDHGRVLAIVLAVIGVIVVNLGSDVAEGRGDRVLLGSALVFGAVVCEAAYTLMGKRLTADLSPLEIVTAAATLALALFLPLAAWDAAGFDWSTPRPVCSSRIGRVVPLLGDGDHGPFGPPVA